MAASEYLERVLRGMKVQESLKHASQTALNTAKSSVLNQLRTLRIRIPLENKHLAAEIKRVHSRFALAENRKTRKINGASNLKQEIREKLKEVNKSIEIYHRKEPTNVNKQAREFAQQKIAEQRRREERKQLELQKEQESQREEQQLKE